jgi:hypothetical protein
LVDIFKQQDIDFFPGVAGVFFAHGREFTQDLTMSGPKDLPQRGFILFQPNHPIYIRSAPPWLYPFLIFAWS